MYYKIGQSIAGDMVTSRLLFRYIFPLYQIYQNSWKNKYGGTNMWSIKSSIGNNFILHDNSIVLR